MAKTLRSRQKKRLVLLDAHGIIHRAYHALAAAELTGPDGMPTGALYGLVSMLLKLITDLEPDYLAACYDLKGPTVRHEAYADYKGTRKAMEDALALQIEKTHEVFEAFAIPTYSKEGFEADDLIGSIADRMKKEVDIIIASGDMDMLQLVDDAKVRVFTVKKGFSDTILYDEKAVMERFGFKPVLVQDLKGIMGDPSDNIKGVPGVGEGSALKLIQTFGGLDAIFRAIKKNGIEATAKEAVVQKRYVQLVADHEEDARFSKSLATIRIDAPIAFTLPGKVWRETIDTQNMFAMCDEFGFRTLKQRIKAMFANESDAGETIELVPEERVDETRLAEASAMLWLISSEFTNPSLDDILAFTKEKTFDAAYAELEKKLAELGRVREVYEKIEKPLIPVIERMEKRGVLVDPVVLKSLAKEYRTELEKIEKRIHRTAGREFNVSSPKQLGEVLFDELHIIPEKQKKTAGGQRSTRESELEKIRGEHPIVSDILEYRELKKLLSTYIDNLPPLLDAEHRLHAEFLQTGTTTGRMASQNPNLQNIPLHSERGKAIRHAFVAPAGFTLLALDYSQIELRLAAILSGDKKLCDIFKNGRDVHTEVAVQVFGVAPDKVDLEMRRRAKVINFGILYGMGVNALRAQLGSTTAEAHQYLENYFSTFKTLSEYLERTKGFARKHGYTETLFGRRRQFPEMKSSLPYVRAQAERMAINAPLQGTSADIIKLAMVRVEEMLKKEQALDDAYLLLQVHDELVYEIKKERVHNLAEKIQHIMESALAGHETHGVPLLATPKTGPDWGSMHV